MARDCPNERKGLSCILCGKDDHDSFDCREKLCFKCNKSGHIASECTEKNVVKCILCGQVGHTSERCLKIWENTNDRKCIGRYEKKGGRHDPFKRCVECNRTGHFKCMKETKSASVNLTFKVAADLDEFFVSESNSSSDEQVPINPDIIDLGPPQKREPINPNIIDLGPPRKRDRKKDNKTKHRRLSNSNLIIPTSDDNQSESSSSEDDRRHRVKRTRISGDK